MVTNQSNESNGSSQQCLDVHSKRDLTNLCEVSHYETGAHLRSTFTYVDEQDVAWFGQVPGVRKYDLTLDDLRRSLERIPDEKVYPPPTPLIIVVPDEHRKNYFIKRPKLLCLDDAEETKLLPRMLIEEAEVLEFLKQNQHPNLVRYYGCTVNRGRVTGIALERHSVIMQYGYEDDVRDLDIAACMEGIRAGVRHFHLLDMHTTTSIP